VLGLDEPAQEARLATVAVLQLHLLQQRAERAGHAHLEEHGVSRSYSLFWFFKSHRWLITPCLLDDVQHTTQRGLDLLTSFAW
jgi:hypothetical protein